MDTFAISATRGGEEFLTPTLETDDALDGHLVGFLLLASSVFVWHVFSPPYIHIFTTI